MSEVTSKMAMPTSKRKTLDRTLEILTMDLDVTDAIIHLRSKEILKEIDEENINAKDTEQKQVSEFVKIIKKRGEKAYLVFREYLGVCQGSEHLAEEMDKNLQAVEKELQGLMIQADGRKQIERWKAYEEKFYCSSCKYDNIGNYTDLPEEINILLIGKTGSGKSATGNTIIGKRCFKESDTSGSVTKTIDKKILKESKYNITVIDTPGLFDTDEDILNEHTVLEIAKTMINFKGEIHLFLLVLSSTARFTQEEHQTFNTVESILGKSVYQNCLVVLTYARAKFGSKDKQSLRQYVTQERKDGGKFADLLKHVSNRIIAVENCFEDDFLSEKHRQKLLCCMAQIIHENEGSVFSNKAFKRAKARVEQQEEEREKRVAMETNLTHMKTRLHGFLVQEYLNDLTVKQLDNIFLEVKNHRTYIMKRSGVEQLKFITSEDVESYVDSFIQENGVLIAKFKDIKIQEAIAKFESEKRRKLLKEQVEINKMPSIVLPLVSNYLKQQSKQALERINQNKQLPDDCINQINEALKKSKVSVDIQHSKSFIHATFFANPKQIQDYIDDKVLKEIQEKTSKHQQQVKRAQKLNGIMETLKPNLTDRLKGKTSKELDELKTELTDIYHSNHWQQLLTELVENQIEGSDPSVSEVTNLFLEQNNAWLQSTFGILVEKRQHQDEADRAQADNAFGIISKVIKESTQSYIKDKTTSEFAKLEAQIRRGEVPSDIYKKVCKKLTIAQQQSLGVTKIKPEILKQVKEEIEAIKDSEVATRKCCCCQ